jgi:hypothetical protein
MTFNKLSKINEGVIRDQEVDDFFSPDILKSHLPKRFSHFSTVIGLMVSTFILQLKGMRLEPVESQAYITKSRNSFMYSLMLGSPPEHYMVTFVGNKDMDFKEQAELCAVEVMKLPEAHYSDRNVFDETLPEMARVLFNIATTGTLHIGKTTFTRIEHETMDQYFYVCNIIDGEGKKDLMPGVTIILGFEVRHK